MRCSDPTPIKVHKLWSYMYILWHVSMAIGLVLHSAMLCSDPTPIKIYTCWSHLHIPGQVSMAIELVLYSVRCFRWFSNYSILEGADLIENEQNPWIPPAGWWILLGFVLKIYEIYQLSINYSNTLHTSCYSKNTAHKLLLQKHCTQVATPKTLHTRCLHFAYILVHPPPGDTESYRITRS